MNFVYLRYVYICNLENTHTFDSKIHLSRKTKDQDEHNDQSVSDDESEDEDESEYDSE